VEFDLLTYLFELNTYLLVVDLHNKKLNISVLINTDIKYLDL